MTLAGLGAGIFFALAIMIREFQMARERAMHFAVQEQLRLSLEGTRVQLRRAAKICSCCKRCWWNVMWWMKLSWHAAGRD